MTADELRESAAETIEAIDLLAQRLRLLATGMPEAVRCQTLAGLARLLNRVSPRASHTLLAGRWVSVPVPGGRVFSDLGEWTTLDLLEGGGWELPLLQVCGERIAPGQTVIDVGGHLGTYAVYFASLVGERGRVITFEPLAENAEQLRRTIKSNGMANIIRVEQAALSDRDGTAQLFAYTRGESAHAARYEDESSMLFSLLCGEGYQPTGVDVPVTTLDTYAEKHSLASVDFIKIDAEGAEETILIGARQVIDRSPNICLLVELHPTELLAQGRSVAHVVELLRGHGFDLTDLAHDRRVVHRRALPAHARVEGSHLLAVRKR